jgi:hypothetical protein
MRKTILFLALGVALTSQSLFAQVPSYVPTNGLVGYWPFNGNANDESGNGNNGVVNGATLTTDRNGNADNAYAFDGLDDFINVLHNPSLNLPNGTINVWFKTSSNNRMTLFNKSNFSDASNEYYGSTLGYLFTVNGPIGITWGRKYNSNCVPGSGWKGLTNNSLNYSDNTYHMITGIISSSSIDVFIDGVKQASIAAPNITADTCGNSNLRFGINWSGDLNPYFGDMDDIGIWNRALTQQEITNLYNSANTNECLTMTINTGVLSTNPVTYTSSVSIYPNPANDQITIDCGNLANVSGWSIKITNMLGQEVFSQPMNTQQYVVPLNTWSGQGMYFVKIINAQNEVVNIKKIILQ